MPKDLSELYVFISYARTDHAVAEQTETFLTEAGVRVFRDVQIPSGADWDDQIEMALRDCNRMVLLLSRSSMPSRKEVYREWFEFNQKNKPIHPLLAAGIFRRAVYGSGDSHRAIESIEDLAARPVVGADQLGRGGDSAHGALQRRLFAHRRMGGGGDPRGCGNVHRAQRSPNGRSHGGAVTLKMDSAVDRPERRS